MKKIQLIKRYRTLLLLLVVSVLQNLPANSQSINNYYDTNFDGYSDESPSLLIKPSFDVYFNPADTGDVIHTVPAPGTNPQALTWDGSNLWCSDIQYDTIYKLDPVDGTVVHSFVFPSELVEGLAWDGTNLWASNNDLDMIYKLDPEDGSIISSIQLVDVWIHGITWDGQYLWMNDFQDKEILKMNPESGEILHNIDAPGTGSIGLTWDGVHLWADDFNTDKLYCLDPTDGAIIYEVNSPSSNPRDLAWDGQYLWVMSSVTLTIYQVDVGSTTGVEDHVLLPENDISFSVYPNPFVDVLNIEFEVLERSKIRIEIYDQHGVQIGTLVNKNYLPGKHLINWDGESESNLILSGGIYHCVLHSGTTKISRKFIVVGKN